MLKPLSHIMQYTMGKERTALEEKTAPTGEVTNVFKNGRLPTKEEYTKIWIDMINRIERQKAQP